MRGCRGEPVWLSAAMAPDRVHISSQLFYGKKRQRKGVRATSVAAVNGKPQLRGVLGRGVCGQVSYHPEAFGHKFHNCWGLESLGPVTALTALTTAAPMTGDTIWEGLITAAIVSLWSDLEPCWNEAAQAREGLPHTFPGTCFLAYTSFLP